MAKAPRFVNGIEVESELRAYQEKARKWDLIMKMAKEEREARSKIKSIAQERAKLMRE